MSQAIRLELDEAVLDRLRLIAQVRGQTVQELIGDLCAHWQPYRGCWLPEEAFGRRGPRIDVCQDCGRPRQAHQGARGLCRGCYMRAYRKGRWERQHA